MSVTSRRESDAAADLRIDPLPRPELVTADRGIPLLIRNRRSRPILERRLDRLTSRLRRRHLATQNPAKVPPIRLRVTVAWMLAGKPPTKLAPRHTVPLERVFQPVLETPLRHLWLDFYTTGDILSSHMGTFFPNPR